MPYDDDEYDDLDPIEVLTNRLMEDPRAQELFDTARGFVDRLGNAIDRLGAKPKTPHPKPRPRRRPPAPPPPPPKPDPRVVLGFAPTATITRADVKRRRQELSRLFHPDKGGNIETMQRINAAADELLATLL